MPGEIKELESKIQEFIDEGGKLQDKVKETEYAMKNALLEQRRY